MCQFFFLSASFFVKTVHKVLAFPKTERLFALQKGICAVTSVEQARGKPQTTGQFVVEGCTAQFKKNHDSLHFYKIPLLEIVLIVGAAEHQNLETFHL